MRWCRGFLGTLILVTLSWCFAYPAQALTLLDRTQERERVSFVIGTVALTLEPLGITPAIAAQEEATRHYLLHQPVATSDTPRPLVIVLHGFGMQPAQQEQLSDFSTWADQENFVVVYPQASGTQPAWHFMATDAQNVADVRFIQAVIADVARRLPLDWRRVYLVGMSNGAQMAARLACVAPTAFAAVALVAGNYVPYNDCVATPLPALLFHGTHDAVLPYNGRKVQFSPQHWAETQAQRNGCADKPVIIFSKALTTAQAWRDCPQPVIFYTIGMGEHSWPRINGAEPVTMHAVNNVIDATQVIGQFFQNYPAAQPPIP